MIDYCILTFLQLLTLYLYYDEYFWSNIKHLFEALLYFIHRYVTYYNTQKIS